MSFFQRIQKACESTPGYHENEKHPVFETHSDLEKKFILYFQEVNIPEIVVADLMCKTCKVLRPPGKEEKVGWKVFYKTMKEVTNKNYSIHDKELKHIDAINTVLDQRIQHETLK